MSGAEFAHEHKDTAESQKDGVCCGSGCGCDSGLKRRDFLKIASAAAAASAVTSWRPVMAGPFSSGDFERLIPSDKKLDPAWVSSLTARGEPAWRRGEALRHIGMPVGGIGAGQVYLAGDGRLWLWDIFNQHSNGVGGRGTTGENYVKPMEPTSPFEQGFAIRIAAESGDQVRALNQIGFGDVSFLGAYPMGQVRYRDEASPVTVDLEAFSPFIPLNADDSGLPATVMAYTVRNTGAKPVTVELAGWLENPVCIHTRSMQAGQYHNHVHCNDAITFLGCSAEPPESKPAAPRPDMVFDGFERPIYTKWTPTGTAFGDGPVEVSKMPAYQGNVGAQGARVVNSHNTRHGEDSVAADAHTGTLTSADFAIERNFINFLIGGGAHPGETCINLVVDGKVVRTATGANSNQMTPHTWGVADLMNKAAHFEIIDTHTGGWGHIAIDSIVFSDTGAQPQGPLDQQSDFGAMGLAVLGPKSKERATSSLYAFTNLESLFKAFADFDMIEAKGTRAYIESIGADRFKGDASRTSFAGRLVGAMSEKLELAPGAEATVRFALVWYFPNLTPQPFKEKVGRYYATRFRSAREVAEYVAKNYERLAGETRRWRDTWYDSTLPYWFLDRTFANTSTLATSTVFRFADGRFYGWEGVGCCQGTCTHVWHYAHAPARIFPELERDTRQRVDFGLSFDTATGRIAYRGEFDRGGADDGQAGTVLRAYREHQMTPDRTFLEHNWPRIKLALHYLIDRDGNADGVIEGGQPNTLDAEWFGRIPWLISLYLAALRAGEVMAEEMNDAEFAQRAKAIRETGAALLERDLFNGEYFVQQFDPAHVDAIGVGEGCHTDQAFGQSWAFQVGLGRLFSEKQTRSALRALWRYNFAPDVGPYKEAIKKGRPFALAGDGGLLMCTWPKGGRREAWNARWEDGYFSECMSGFEHQVAGHMIWEGLVQEGLAVCRAIHDRYHPRLRNPYNEVECSDHYARAMASYGVFLAACGYEYHGPKGHIGFAPRLTPEAFHAPFTAAEGWGTYAQAREKGAQRGTLTIKWGRLRLRSLAFGYAGSTAPTRVTVTLNGATLSAKHVCDAGRILITLDQDVTVAEGKALAVEFA